MFDFKKKKFRKEVGTFIRDLGSKGSYLVLNDAPEVSLKISTTFSDRIDESFERGMDKSNASYVLIAEVIEKLCTDKDKPWKSSFMDVPLYEVAPNMTTSNKGGWATIKYYFFAAAHKLCDDDSPLSSGLKKDLVKSISQLLPFPVDDDNNSWVFGYKNYFQLLENFWALRLSKMDRYLVEFTAGLNLQKIAYLYEQHQYEENSNMISIDSEKVEKYAAEQAILDYKLKEIALSVSNKLNFKIVESEEKDSSFDFYKSIEFDDIKLARLTITETITDAFNELDEITKYAFSHHYYWGDGFFKYQQIQTLALEAGETLLEKSGVDDGELSINFDKKFPLLDLFRLINIHDLVKNQMSKDHMQQANDIFSDR